jgi:hypothetical protein
LRLALPDAALNVPLINITVVEAAAHCFQLLTHLSVVIWTALQCCHRLRQSANACEEPRSRRIFEPTHSAARLRRELVHPDSWRHLKTLFLKRFPLPLCGNKPPDEA